MPFNPVLRAYDQGYDDGYFGRYSPSAEIIFQDKLETAYQNGHADGYEDRHEEERKNNGKSLMDYLCG